MLAGVVSGKTLPGLVQLLRSLEFGRGSQVNVPIRILIWLMIAPIDDKSRFHVNPKNWPTAARPDGHAVCELAGEAVFDGLDFMDLSSSHSQ